jgi:hypothetical protein
MDEAKLVALLEKLGAPDPAEWARSETCEGIPQVARFLFLRQAWRRLLPPANTAWIAEGLQRSPKEPGGGIARALSNALATGVSREDLTEIVRVKQWELLFDLCYLLSDPQADEVEAADIAWGLFEIGPDGLPARLMDGLHESVLETDPSGREMRGT